nr:hypothetical protein [Arabidopsis thaliana]
MVELSEIPGDPNGADPNNNPQEEDEEVKNLPIHQEEQKIHNENLPKEKIHNENPQEQKIHNENPQEQKIHNENLPVHQEEEKIHNENPQEQKIHNENLPILLQLPEELIERIIAHFPQCYSPSPILVCETFRQVINSDHFYYVTRSLLSFTKPVLYALIAFQAYTRPSWFFLRQSNIALQLHRIRSYEPVQGLWESWGEESELMRFWHSVSSCVVGDLLYALDLTCALEHPIVVYYPNEFVWRPVMGVDTAHLPILCEYRSTLANFDGKLVILGGGDCSESSSEIWCVEIALETRQGDQIWGVVKSVSIVSRDLPMRHVIELCRTVMV